MDEPVDTQTHAPREPALARALHAPGPLFARSIAVGLVIAAVSLAVSTLVYLAFGLHGTDTPTAIVMYGLPVVLPLVVAPVVVYQLLRISRSLHERTRELEAEISRRRTAEARLAVLANQDDLTQLINRRAFFTRAQHVSETTAVTSTAVLDLDNFKALNDTHGHAAGDEALRKLGRLLLEQLPESTIIGRLGGEEFGILFPDITTDQAIGTLDVVRARIPEIGWQLTASCGVTEWRPGGESIDMALARADAALYRAKQRGRDRLEYVPHGQPSDPVSEFAPLARRGPPEGR